jgi:N-acetylglucosamine-6-phosphate deacetylase
MVAPGLIDLHIHGALGRDAMEASTDAFEAICRYHALGGTTALVLTTVSAPIAEVVTVLKAVNAYRRERRVGAQLLGIHMEGPYLNPARGGVHRAEALLLPDSAEYALLLEHAATLKIMTLAPELPGALELIDVLRERGVWVSGGHSDAWEADAMAAFARGMRGATHTFNSMSSARRQGPYRVAGLLEVALSEPEIICELIADGRHVSPTLMKMLYRAKGAEGIALVSDATAGAGLPEESEFRLGAFTCHVRNGAGMADVGGMLAGSVTTMIDAVRMMVREVDVPLVEAWQMGSATPARALGLSHKGRLEIGADADLVIVSDALEIVATFVQGERVE